MPCLGTTATRTTLALAFAFVAAVAAVHRVDAAEAAAPWPTAGWQTSTPEEQGMASSALAELVDFGAAHAMDSLLVIRHGRIVVEAHYAPFRPGFKHVVNSVTKAVVGSLTGIAIKDGTLARLDQPVLEFFPERTVANVDADKKAMTLESLLDMTSGLAWQEPLSNAVPETMLQMERSGDWVGFILDRPMAQAPGVGFNYDSGNSHLLSAILSKKTGSSTLDYARHKLFAPLGITDVSWRQDPQGIQIGGYGLFMQPRDMAKIGYLYLHDGEWAGQRLLPPAWTDKVYHAAVDMGFGAAPAFRYANGWWTIPDKRAYMAVGFLRQLIIVLPDVDVVAVATGRRHYPFVPLIDGIVGAVTSQQQPLPADTGGSARLAERVKDAATEKPSAVGPTPDMAKAISGRTYRFAANGLRLKSLRLDLSAAGPRYEVALDGSGPGAPTQHLTGPLGLDGYFRVGEQDANPLLAVKGNWLSESNFQIVSRSLLDGIVTTYSMSFRGSELDLAFEDNRGVRGRLHGESAE
jgi:CubicO group peptidase (beta-lactamase class C family)